MADPLRINRDELAKFLPNHETIIQFENLFNIGEEVQNANINDLSYDAETAISKANTALALTDGIRDLIRWQFNGLVLDPIDTIPIDGARINTQPTGSEALAISTTKYVDDNTFWARSGTKIQPKFTNDDVDIYGNMVFNKGALDKDFSVNKLTSGISINYDAGTDALAFDATTITIGAPI